MMRHYERLFQNVENEVEQAMAVMDQDTGRMLNYRQLRRHPNKEVRKAWTKSAATNLDASPTALEED